MRRLRSARVRTRPKPPKRPSGRCWPSSRHVRTTDNCPLETRFSSRSLRGLWSTELPSWPQPNVSRLTPGLGFSSSPTSSLTNHYRLLRRLSQSETRTRNREIWVHLQHCSRCVHARARQALQIILAHRLHLCGHGSNATELRAHEKASRSLATQ